MIIEIRFFPASGPSFGELIAGGFPASSQDVSLGHYLLGSRERCHATLKGVPEFSHAAS